MTESTPDTSANDIMVFHDGVVKAYKIFGDAVWSCMTEEDRYKLEGDRLSTSGSTTRIDISEDRLTFRESGGNPDVPNCENVCVWRRVPEDTIADAVEDCDSFFEYEY